VSPAQKKSAEEKPVDVVKAIDDLEAYSDEPNVLLAQQLHAFFTRLEKFLGRFK
jgi:hypothetical protein